MARTFGSIAADEIGWPDAAPSGSGATDSGTQSLVNGQAFIDVTLNSTQADANWIFVDSTVVNTTDGSPLNIGTGIVTAKSTTGFTVKLTAAPDSNNYYLIWAIGASIVATTAFRTTTAGDSRVTTAGDDRITT